MPATYKAVHDKDASITRDDVKGFLKKRSCRTSRRKAYTVSQYEHRKSHAVSRKKMHGNPAQVLSPCKLI